MRYIILLALLVSASAFAQEPDSTSALYRMRETERNFARASVMIGRNAAFAEFFADESLIFTDRWQKNGRQYSKEHKPVPYVLKWEPEYMDIAASRDFGVSTGPWELQEYRPGTKPVAMGYFLTVWKKQQDGTWKVILDGGSESPALPANDHNFGFPAGADKDTKVLPVEQSGKSEGEMMAAEQQLITDWGKQPGIKTYSRFLASDARIIVNGHIPATTYDSVSNVITKLDRFITWKPEGIMVASSGDLGFTYGTLKNVANQGASKGNYVRIWKKDKTGVWKISIEMLNPE